MQYLANLFYGSGSRRTADPEPLTATTRNRRRLRVNHLPSITVVRDGDASGAASVDYATVMVKAFINSTEYQRRFGP